MRQICFADGVDSGSLVPGVRLPACSCQWKPTQSSGLFAVPFHFPTKGVVIAGDLLQVVFGKLALHCCFRSLELEPFSS